VKKAGIHIIAVAVIPAGVPQGIQELQEIADNPDSVLMLQVNTFAQLQSKLNLLLQYACLLGPNTGKYIQIRTFIHKILKGYSWAIKYYFFLLCRFIFCSFFVN